MNRVKCMQPKKPTHRTEVEIKRQNGSYSPYQVGKQNKICSNDAYILYIKGSASCNIYLKKKRQKVRTI